MLTDMTPAAAGQLYPQLQSISKSPVHGHVDHPGLRGTPLAMLAAQCNKLSSKSPPPLADAAVGKGFHPWKKSPQSSGSSPQHTSNAGAGGGCTTTGVTQRPTATSSAGSTGGGYARAPVTSCASTAPQYASDLYFPGTASAQPATDHHHQTSILGKVEGATLGSCSVYGRHPYESWPFNAMPGASHGGIKATDGWWDVHGAATGGWLDVSGTVGIGAHAAQMANYSADYSTSLALAGNHLLSQTSAGHNLLQDTYKSMLPGGPPGFGLHHHSGGSGGASSPQSASSATGGGVTQAPSPRSQRRYTGRATCDCPNCQEAERLGPAGVHLRKKNIHSCHIPGCGKVYGKTSHLKAHLRWHTAAPSNPHRRKEIRLPGLQQAVHAQRSPREARQDAQQQQQQRQQGQGGSGELVGRVLLRQRGQRESAESHFQQLGGAAGAGVCSAGGPAGGPVGASAAPANAAGGGGGPTGQQQLSGAAAAHQHQLAAEQRQQHLVASVDGTHDPNADDSSLVSEPTPSPPPASPATNAPPSSSSRGGGGGSGGGLGRLGPSPSSSSSSSRHRDEHALSPVGPGAASHAALGSPLSYPLNLNLIHQNHNSQMLAGMQVSSPSQLYQHHHHPQHHPQQQQQQAGNSYTQNPPGTPGQAQTPSPSSPPPVHSL